MDYGPKLGLRGSGEAPACDFALPAMDKVRFGPSSICALGEEVDRLGAGRALIVTGRTLANDTDLVGRLEGVLGDRLAGVFAETEQHVPRGAVIAAAAAAREVGADIVISFGGGSPVDTAKLVTLCVTAGVESEDGLDAFRFQDGQGFPAVPRIEMPHIAVPTTLSAGEHTPWAGSTDTRRGAKDAYKESGLTPRLVLLDPELTAATPARLWGPSGIKALDHAVETVCSTSPTPYSTALARGAIEILGARLVQSVADPDDVVSRGLCQVAAWMSVFSMPSVAPGLSHAIGHQLGAHCEIPHGMTSCIVLPAVMEFNAPVNAPRQRLVAEALGLDVSGRDDAAAAKGAADAVRAIVAGLGVKTRLRDWGVTEEDIAAIAADSIEDHMAFTNPRRLQGSGEVVDLLRFLR